MSSRAIPARHPGILAAALVSPWNARSGPPSAPALRGRGGQPVGNDRGRSRSPAAPLLPLAAPAGSSPGGRGVADPHRAGDAGSAPPRRPTREPLPGAARHRAGRQHPPCAPSRVRVGGARIPDRRLAPPPRPGWDTLERGELPPDRPRGRVSTGRRTGREQVPRRVPHGSGVWPRAHRPASRSPRFHRDLPGRGIAARPRLRTALRPAALPTEDGHASHGARRAAHPRHGAPRASLPAPAVVVCAWPRAAYQPEQVALQRAGAHSLVDPVVVPPRSTFG